MRFRPASQQRGQGGRPPLPGGWDVDGLRKARASWS